MNNNILLAYVVNILPKLTLSFVGILLLYKLYFSIRSKYGVWVNCWFCSENAKVPYAESNSWTCTKCEQYNGFTKEGDYNREIKAQFECNNDKSFSEPNYWITESTNGFCDACNEAQRLKVEKLALFEPKKESRFDAELKAYKTQLEEQYGLCATCDRHLKSVLRNKKKMVLGTKFLEFMLKSAEAIKDTQSSKIKLVQQILWKRRLSFLITILTLINLGCLAFVLPNLNRTWFTSTFGDLVGEQTFILCSHIVAFWRLILSFITKFLENETVVRFGLFMRTIFMMLLYSLGLRLPQVVRLNFSSLYLLMAPFSILATIFSYNVIDRFKLSRYTILLALWSVYAGGILEQNTSGIYQVLMFAASIMTVLLTGTSKVETSPRLFDKNSFHKIYSDDYASEFDTAGSSVLSYPFDCSSLSARSDISNSFSSLKRSTFNNYDRKSPLSSSTLSLNMTPRATPRTTLPPFPRKSPLTSSTFSLNQTTRTMQDYAHNESFKSFNNNSTLRSRLPNSTLNSTFTVPNSSFNAFGRSEQPTNTSLSTANWDNLLSIDRRSNRSQQTQVPAPSLRSCFSASTSALHHHNEGPSPSPLLSPSRFSVNSTVGFVSTTNKFPNVNNIFKQNKELNTVMRPSSILGSSNLPPINEYLSRASSRSSGFESQNDNLNNSRENSCGPEPMDLQNKTPSVDNLRGFQPIRNGPTNNVGINNTFSLLSLHQPLSVNCSSTWQQTSNNRNLFDSSSTIKRGDLLRKWKEGAVVA